jgi:hypothetical protein
MKKVFLQGSSDFCRNWAWYNKLEFYFFLEKFCGYQRNHRDEKSFPAR